MGCIQTRKITIISGNKIIKTNNKNVNGTIKELTVATQTIPASKKRSTLKELAR